MKVFPAIALSICLLSGCNHNKDHTAALLNTPMQIIHFRTEKEKTESFSHEERPIPESIEAGVNNEAKQSYQDVLSQQIAVTTLSDIYRKTHPYLYIVDITMSNHFNQPVIMTVQFYRDFSIEEMRKIIRDELKAAVTSGENRYYKETIAYGLVDKKPVLFSDCRYDDCIVYHTITDKILSKSEYFLNKIDQEKKGERFYPIFKPVSVKQDDDNLIKVRVESNLPDNCLMKIYLMMQDNNGEYLDFWEQSAIVKDGIFETDFVPINENKAKILMGDSKNTLSITDCSVLIVSDPPYMQPKSVQEILGNSGQNLEGPLVYLSPKEPVQLIYAFLEEGQSVEPL